MNAYQILGIMSHIDNEMDEKSANEKIMNKVKTIVLSSIEQINQIINSNDISTEEKVKKIGDGVSATVRVIVSYMKIIDAEKRKAYNLTDKTIIDDELISVDSANRQNGKNAYQTIGVSSLETYGLNSRIAENTYSAYVLAMKQTDTKSLEELMETLLRMKKYDWAYSKIKSVNDREQYNLNYHNRNYINRLRRNAHSPENSSDEWAFFFLYIKYTFVVTQIATKSWIKNHLFPFSVALHTFAHRREVQILSTCPKYALKSLLDAILKSIYNWVRNQL